MSQYGCLVLRLAEVGARWRRSGALPGEGRAPVEVWCEDGVSRWRRRRSGGPGRRRRPRSWCRGRCCAGWMMRAAEPFGRGQRRGHVLDGDEEQHLVLGALPGADRDVGAALDAGVDEGVAREGALGGDLPAEQVGEELCGSRRGRPSGSRRGRRGGPWQSPLSGTASSRSRMRAGHAPSPLPTNATRLHRHAADVFLRCRCAGPADQAAGHPAAPVATGRASRGDVGAATRGRSRRCV